MSRLVQLCVLLYCLVKLTLAFRACTGETPVSICTDGRRQGDHVYVDFSLVPLQENNVSCSCFIFAQSDTEILAAYQTSPASNIKLINTSIRLGDQTFEEATKGFIQLSANSFKKLHFNGDIGTQPPRVCLRFNSSNATQIEIEAVCLAKGNTTVPTSGFSNINKTTAGTASETKTQPASETTKQPTSDAVEQSTHSFAEQLSQHEHQPRTHYTVTGVAVGGGFLVVAIVIVVVVIMCRRRRLSVSQNVEQNINMSVNQTEENAYNVENELYVSADDDILAGGNRMYDVTHLQGFDVNHDKAKITHDVTNNLSGSDNTYEQPDQYNPKQNVEHMNRCRSSNEYSVVFKNKKNTPSMDDTDTYDHVNRI